MQVSFSGNLGLSYQASRPECHGRSHCQVALHQHRVLSSVTLTKYSSLVDGRFIAKRPKATIGLSCSFFASSMSFSINSLEVSGEGRSWGCKTEKMPSCPSAA